MVDVGGCISRGSSPENSEGVTPSPLMVSVPEGQEDYRAHDVLSREADVPEEPAEFFKGKDFAEMVVCLRRALVS